MTPSKATRVAVQCIIDSLYADPDAWRLTDFTARGPNGVEIWIANGWGCIEVELPNKMRMGVISKIRLWRAIKTVQAAKVATASASLATKTPRRIAAGGV